MMKYFVLLILLTVILMMNPSYGAPPSPPTNFVATIIDESNKQVEISIYLQIDEILNGETVQSYRLDLFENPQSIPVAWFVPSTAENTEIHIIAVKQGFVNSDEFVFKITSQTPTEGILFEHTFVLKTEETSMISDKNYQVTSSGKSFTIATKSASNIQSIDFLEAEKTVLIVLNEESLSGFTDLTIPASLISPPFKILLDDVTVFPTEEKSGQSVVLHFEYTNGLHNIRVISPVDTTVPQTGQGIESEFEQQVEESIEKTEDVCGAGTIENESGQCVPVADARGGGCLIATATFGSELAPQVQQLREIRDNSLLQTESGRSFMESFNSFYYSFSPGIADLERENPVFKEAVKIAITPLITSLSILNYVDIDSEIEMISYGVSLIMLNVGMYFVAPIVAIVKLRKMI